MREPHNAGLPAGVVVVLGAVQSATRTTADPQVAVVVVVVVMRAEPSKMRTA